METSRDRWEDFHQSKSSQSMALEWPDDYVVRFGKRWLNLSGICKIVDMNCGAGRHTALLAALGYDVTGFDLSQNALDLAGKLLDTRGVSAQLRQGSSLAMPFAEASFDALVAWRSLHVFSSENIPRVVAEMRRVVRPGGKILFSTRSDRNIYDEERIGITVPRPTDLSLDQIESLCTGLQVEQIELSEFTSQNRRLRDSYWVVAASR
jgi:SAM-dependent methyltransferase